MSGRTGCLLVMCLYLSIVACGTDLYEEVMSSSGGRIQILLVAHDDPSLLVNARVVGADGATIDEGIRLGATRRNWGLGSNRFGLYETSGGRVGLYRESKPDVLLLAVDFEEREVISDIGSGREGSPERREKILAELSSVAGRPLEFARSPESF